MLYQLLCVVLMMNVCVGEDSDEDYVDSVINMLLNGGSRESVQTNEFDDDVEPVLLGGVWKCGNCDNIGESNLMYSEVNEVVDKTITEAPVDVQIGFTLPGMQCITIESDTPGVVRRISGGCTTGALTLSVATAAHFTVQIYN